MSGTAVTATQQITHRGVTHGRPRRLSRAKVGSGTDDRSPPARQPASPRSRFFSPSPAEPQRRQLRVTSPGAKAEGMTDRVGVDPELLLGVEMARTQGDRPRVGGVQVLYREV